MATELTDTTPLLSEDDETDNTLELSVTQQCHLWRLTEGIDKKSVTATAAQTCQNLYQSTSRCMLIVVFGAFTIIVPPGHRHRRRARRALRAADRAATSALHFGAHHETGLTGMDDRHARAVAYALLAVTCATSAVALAAAAASAAAGAAVVPCTPTKTAKKPMTQRQADENRVVLAATVRTAALTATAQRACRAARRQLEAATVDAVENEFAAVWRRHKNSPLALAEAAERAADEAQRDVWSTTTGEAAVVSAAGVPALSALGPDVPQLVAQAAWQAQSAVVAVATTAINVSWAVTRAAVAPHGTKAPILLDAVDDLLETVYDGLVVSSANVQRVPGKYSVVLGECV